MLFKRVFFNAVGGITGLVLFALTMLPNMVQSAGFDISPDPLFLMQPVEPLVMLSVSTDQQLYFTAYPDYADLNKDGQADRGYIHANDYYGYFDSYKCYNYGSGKFTPASVAMTKYCAGNWSGNFLNWVSMARIDVVRKILYGGYRSTDTAAATVLERTYLPNDAHSWVKYYEGADVDKLTPFSLEPTATGTSTSSNTMKAGSATASGDRINFTITWTGDAPQSGDQLYIQKMGDATRWMQGVYLSGTTVQITSSSGVPSSNPNIDSWRITNESRKGISFCNTTVSATTLSQSVTDPPLLRVAKGNYSLWAANERWQCRWSTEKYNTGHDQMKIGTTKYSNGNIMSITGTPANADNPVKANVGLGSSDYNVRIDACVSEALIGKENCKKYPDGNIKPIGLLQEYGDDDALYFGLTTGSYTKNKSGGVLRKNTGVMTDEINVKTSIPTSGDGTFKVPASGNGIINTLNKLRIYGYRHDDGTYFGTTGSADCSWGLSSFTDGKCSSWGNPQSEIFLEALRYFTQSAQATSGFNVTGDDKIAGLKAVSTWVNPLSNRNWCAALNVINFNASVPSYDNDQFSSISSLGASSIATLTDIVGAGEDIHGNSWFVGSTGVGSNQLCTAKTVSSLGAVTGPCPEGPRLDGTFHIAGLAHYAYTNDLRTDLSNDQVIKTYGVTLAPAVPKLVIPKTDGTPAATILPACRNKTISPEANCAIVEFKIISQDVAGGTGSILVQWEDSEQGGDYDMDMNGILNYKVVGSEITITTRIFAQSSPNIMGFGYVISGTTKDGFHVHSGVNNFNYTDPTGVTGCSNCKYDDAEKSVTYTLGASSGDSLKDPLYYAAKWGGYDKDLKHPTTSQGFPDYQMTWDSKSADGVDKPDNYYYAIDPALLAKDLSEVFNNVRATVGSSSAVASNSTSQNTVDALYQAKLNSEDWSGQLLRYALVANGTIGTNTPTWETHSTMDSINDESRKVYTFGSSGGVDFKSSEWDNLTTDQQTFLKDGGSEDDATKRINWIRGDRTQEATGVLRKRNRLLGDIINSNPFYHQKTNTVYVGANDGMLHAFNAATGAEKFAYIPKSVYANLAKLTKPTYKQDGHRYFVDGSPIVVDTTATQSILVGTTGAGGRSVFALNVNGTTAATTVLWEFTAPDLGYTIGQPVIGSIGGTKVVIFGNGYNSDNHRAILYVLKLETSQKSGEVLYTINTGTGDAASPNGLASPGLLPDAAGNSVAAYAGDAQGNLWKFDLSSSSGTVAFSGQPLFEAAGPAPGNLQPISGGVDIGRHPNGGYLIFFGTGKYFEVNDKQIGTRIHSLYGIWDKGDGSTVSGRGVLQQQTILGQQYTVGNNFRLLSKTPVNWATKRGWYVDLAVDKDGHSTCDAAGENCTATGERVMEKPLLNRGLVFFTTLTPYDSGLPCEPIGTTWFLAVDMLTGGELTKASFDVNRDSNFNQYDTITVTLANGTTATGFAGGFQAIAAGIAKATLIETPTGGTSVVFSGIEGLANTANATSNSGKAIIQSADAALVAAQAADDSATAAAAAAEAAAQAKTDADNAAAAAPDDAALATAAEDAGKAKDDADAAARQANRDAAQAIVDAAQAIIDAAQDIINAGGVGGVTVSDAQGVITEATTIKGQALASVTSGDTLPPDLPGKLRPLLGILKGSSDEGVQTLSLFPQKTWRQLR